MRNKKTILTVLVLLITSAIYSANLKYKDYDWELISDFPAGVEEELLIMKHQVLIQFAYVDQKLYKYELVRQIEFVNSNEQVSQSNKVYIPLYGSSELIEARARVVKPNKEVVELDEDMILSAYDEQLGYKYRYFALEGLEEGSIIDYYYVLKKTPGFFGVEIDIQQEYPIQEFDFDLYSPSNLKFQFKVFNDSKEVKENISGSYYLDNHWWLNCSNIPAHIEEDEAPMELLRKKLAIVFQSNTASKKSNFSVYEQVSEYTIEAVSNENKKDNRAIKRLLKKIDIEDDSSDSSKIFKVENYIKDNIQIDNSSNKAEKHLREIIENKRATRFDLVKIYSRIYKMLNIEHEIVLTCDRNKAKLDPEFELISELSQYLIYFPKTNIYIAPGEFGYRNGYIPEEFTDNRGLFIKLNGLWPYHDIRYIEPRGHDDSYSWFKIKASLGQNMMETTFDYTISYFGDYGVWLQSYMGNFDNQRKKKYTIDQIKSRVPSFEVDTWDIENDKADLLGIKPINFNYTGISKNLIEKAGNKYLFKLGEVIGPQIELYDKEERKLPVYRSNGAKQNHTIEIAIPSGYVVQNLSDIKIHREYINDNNEKSLFDSDYKLEGNTLIVNITEYYDQLYWEPEEYNDYKRVINAAADFNKVVLILEKE